MNKPPEWMCQNCGWAGEQGAISGCPSCRVLGEAWAALPTLDGWCTREKAKLLIGLIFAHKPKVCVEIGVYGGSSLIPMAMALRATGGVIVGVDPWTTEAVLEGTHSDVNASWWGGVNLEAIRNRFFDRVQALRLTDQVRVRAVKADAMVAEVPDGGVDLLHLDGNHSKETSMRECVQWLPKVASGGHIVMDDVHWHEGAGPTQKDAVRYLLDNGCVITEQLEDGNILAMRKDGNDASDQRGGQAG